LTTFCQACHHLVSQNDARCGACQALPPERGFPRDERLGAVVASGQFRVARRLGSGGFGVVYEVETIVGGLRRAMKVLSNRWADDASVQQRFINEATVLEEVHHPNVARCYAAGRLEDDGLYLLFELIEGVQLASLIATKTLEPIRAVRIAKQIAAGLQAAHVAGVIHRDLKPENILVREPGTRREHVSIVDFGIAKLTDGGLTSTQTVVGTPQFMAPEQFRPGSPLDARVDLWQLGALLFVMLTGRPPYKATEGGIASLSAQHQRRTDLGPAPSEIDPHFRELGGLDLLVRRLLATNPDRRPASASEACDELARVEHALSPTHGGGSIALLGALCATPSESAWIALHGYLASQSEGREALVDAGARMLSSWPAELRRAPLALWEVTRRGEAHPLWPLARTLDLSARGLGDDEVRSLADNPALQSVTRLDLSRNEIGNAGLEALARSPHLAGLEHLDLSSNRLSSAGLEMFTASRGTGRLRSLRLANNGIGARGAEALAASRLPLVDLDLSGNDLGPAGVSALADSETLEQLVSLGLAGNHIGPQGVAALAVSPRLRRLRILDLGHNGIGPSGAAAVALSAHMRTLRTLKLGRNALGREGLQLLLTSTTLDDLHELDLSGNTLGAAGAMFLAASPFVRRLESLDLSDDALGDAGVAALLGSPHLGGLRTLVLAQNGTTAAGAGLLASAPPQLESLDLSDNPLGDGAAAPIADALQRLRIGRLRLKRCGFGAAGIAQLVRVGRLLQLDASHNDLGRRGAEMLAMAAESAQLETLEIAQCGLGAEGVRALFSSSVSSSLRHLDLSSNQLGDEGVTALVANAPRLPRLESLTLMDDELGPHAAEALAVSSLAAHLRLLRLSHNHLGDRGAELLARGPSWHALRVLDLRGNRITLAGASTVLSAPAMAMVERVELSENVLTGEADMHSLSSDAATIMEQSFEHIAALGADFAERFYAELFARFPNVKPLFASVAMARQQQHLMSALVLVIDNLRNPDVAESQLLELGRRHVGYGVVPSHYYAVVTTLLDAIRDALGERWTDEVQTAWTDGLQAVASVMMRAKRIEPAAAQAITVRSDH